MSAKAHSHQLECVEIIRDEKGNPIALIERNQAINEYVIKKVSRMNATDYANMLEVIIAGRKEPNDFSGSDNEER